MELKRRRRGLGMEGRMVGNELRGLGEVGGGMGGRGSRKEGG